MTHECCDRNVLNRVLCGHTERKQAWERERMAPCTSLGVFQEVSVTKVIQSNSLQIQSVRQGQCGPVGLGACVTPLNHISSPNTAKGKGCCSGIRSQHTVQQEQSQGREATPRRYLFITHPRKAVIFSETGARMCRQSAIAMASEASQHGGGRRMMACEGKVLDLELKSSPATLQMSKHRDNPECGSE